MTFAEAGNEPGIRQSTGVGFKYQELPESQNTSTVNVNGQTVLLNNNLKFFEQFVGNRPDDQQMAAAPDEAEEKDSRQRKKLFTAAMKSKTNLSFGYTQVYKLKSLLCFRKYCCCCVGKGCKKDIR